MGDWVGMVNMVDQAVSKAAPAAWRNGAWFDYDLASIIQQATDKRLPFIVYQFAATRDRRAGDLEIGAVRVWLVHDQARGKEEYLEQLAQLQAIAAGLHGLRWSAQPPTTTGVGQVAYQPNIQLDADLPINQQLMLAQQPIRVGQVLVEVRL